MKKIMTVFLCLALFLGAVGCGGSAEEKEELIHSDGYSKLWSASDDSVSHETGDLAVDAGWGAVISEDAKAGALAFVTVNLQATQYTFVARLCTDGYSASNTNAIVKMRALNESGVEIGSKTIYMRDFDESLAYKDFSLTFSVSKQQDVRLQIYWPGYEYARVSEFAIMSKNQDGADYKTKPEGILGIDRNETVPAVKSNEIYYFDLYDWAQSLKSDTDFYDVSNLISTLQGLVNRDGVRLFVRNMASNRFTDDTDGYWLDTLTSEGNWLGDKTVVNVETPVTLLKMFADYYGGWAVWDQSVPATVNAVATACGADGLLPLRWSSDKGSLYAYIVNSALFADKEVKVDLSNKFLTSKTGDKIYQSETLCTGSRKNDVYIWAKEQYLDARKTNSHMVAYHVDAYSLDTVCASYSDLDNMYLANRDYYIAEKAFFFDLSVMEFEIPNDDPDQADLDVQEGTIDYKTFTAIMKSQNKYAADVDASTPIDVGGFTPWHLKYTAHTNPSASGDVAVEWETVYQFSIYFAQINADAPSYTAMANGSVYRQYPVKDSYTQSGKYSAGNVDPNEKLPASNEKGVNYLLFYFGDFDSAAWLNTAMPNFWNDPKRGEIPVCYSFALDLYKRAGHVIDWMYQTAGENDYFVAGDNGTGYLDPEAFYASWRDSSLNGGMDEWKAYNQKLFTRFDIDVEGFLILTSRSTDEQKIEILQAYSSFSPVGLGTNRSSLNNLNVNGMQVVSEIDYSTSEALANSLTDKTDNGVCTFTMVRFILQKPSDIYNLYQNLLNNYPQKNVKVLDPYTFFALQKQYNGN